MEKIAKQLVWNVLFEKAVSYDEKEQYSLSEKVNSARKLKFHTED